jgi:glycine C-acetyltransferase
VSHFGLDPADVDIQVGTLSKAIGVLGGFIAGSQHLVAWLVNRGRPFLFSTSAPPAAAAACIEALDILEESPQLVERLWERTRFFKAGLTELGFDTGESETPITPVMAGEETKAVELSRLLWDEGVFSPAIIYPTVAKGKARVRTIVTAEHTEDDLREALDAFERVGRKLGLI